MEKHINTLKEMINEAKTENDYVLVEYLTKALKHIIEKQNANNKSYNNLFDADYSKISKSILVLEMNYNEINNKSEKKPEEYEALLFSYKLNLKDLEDLYDNTYKKIIPEKEQEILNKINSIKQRIKELENNIKNMKEINNFYI